MKTILSSLALLAALTGCTMNRPKAPPVALGPNSVPQKTVTITDRDHIKYVELLPKGTLTVSLETNTAAGSQWKLAKPLDPNVLKVVPPSSAQLAPIALPPDNLSTVTSENWVFKAVGPGTAKVRMIYARPDAPLSEAVNFEFTVNAE